MEAKVQSQPVRKWWSQRLNPGYLRDNPRGWGIAGWGRYLSAFQEPGQVTFRTEV